MRRHVLTAVVLSCFSLSLRAQNLVTMTHELESSSVRAEFTYSGNPPGGKFYYQKYLNTQALGTPQAKDPAAESTGNSVVLLLPLSSLTDADEVGIYFQSADAAATKSPELRVSLNELSNRNEIARHKEKERDLSSKVSQLTQDNQRLISDNAALNAAFRSNQGVARGVHYVDAPAVYTDAMVLHFQSQTVGRLRVTIADNKPAPNHTERTVDGEFTRDHYIRFSNLPAGDYTVVAWPLDLQNRVIDNDKTDTDQQGNAIIVSTHASVDKIQLDPILQVSVTENTLEISVAAPKSDRSLVRAELYRAGEDALIQHKGDDLSLPSNKLPAAASLHNTWPQPFKFEELAAGTKYHVIVKAMNELGDVSVRETDLSTSPAFDFAGDVDVNLTPAGYILQWHANAEPISNGNDPSKVQNGFRLTFGADKPVTSVPATINGKDLTAALDVAGVQALLAKSTQPSITLFMTSKAGKVVDRALRVHLDKPDAATLTKLNLSDADKKKVQSAIDKAAQGGVLNKSIWQKIWQQGLKALITVLG